METCLNQKQKNAINVYMVLQLVGKATSFVSRPSHPSVCHLQY